MYSNIFDQNATRYDDWYIKNKVLFECEAKVMRALDLQGRGLSVGVGTGILDSQVQIEIGIEPALGMLKFASARGINPIQAVSENIPFKDESFDFLLMTLTLCFLDSPKKAIRELYRVLRFGGELAICIVTKDSAWGKEYIKKAEKGHIFYSLAHFYSLSEIRELLEDYSFKITVLKSTLSFPPTAIPKLEEPSEKYEGRGFVCIKAVKIN